jgi:hypothetical protein
LVLGTSGVSSASTILGTASGAYTFTASSNRQIIAQGGLTAAANTTYTVSLYVESNPNSALASQMLSIVGNPAGSTFTAPAGTPAAGTRITATLVVGATAGTFDLRLGIGVTGNTTGTVRISCPQIEAGTFATSYIPTTTTSLTRNADVVSMTGTNFSDWYNATQGTFFAQYTAGLNGVFAFSAVNSTTPTTEAMYLRYNASQHQGVTVTGGVNVSAIFDVTGASAVNNVKTAFAYKANAYGIRSNGGASATAAANSASGALPSGINKLSIGSNQTGAAGFLNACIAKLSYYNISLLNAELSAVSK